MVMRSESYLTEQGLSPVAPIPGLLWSAGSYTPFRLNRAIKRDKEDMLKYQQAMQDLRPKLNSGNRWDPPVASDDGDGGSYRLPSVHDAESSGTEKSPKVQLVWRSLVFFTVLHILAVAGLACAFTSAKLLTSLFAVFCYLMGGLGVTAGVHRLWSHRTYRARWQLRTLLMLMFTMAGQNHIWEWVQDHRLHHRYSETDADPHNATRGFFFAHMGWLFVTKHPKSIAQEKTTDMSDMMADPVVVFQKRHYFILVALLCFVVPTAIPVWLWHERVLTALLVCGVLRYVCTLHSTWLVNSAAHLWGRRPYDRFINPAENPMVALAALGEGWHNYHHSFPWDYRTAELGGGRRNLTTSFIDLMARIGWAYDRKTVAQDMVTRRAERKGDGSYQPTQQ